MTIKKTVQVQIIIKRSGRFKLLLEGGITMDITYQVHIAGFEQSKFLDVNKEKEIEELRIRFVSDYSEGAINDLEIDEYINGKGDRSTFCNRIETQLKDWGNMKGAFATKFGVYYGVFGRGTEKKYQITGKWGSTVEQAFDKVKREIVNLIQSGATKDFDKINNNLISPMLKGKILSLYYPNDYLNIFSSSHLDFFINQLSLGLTKGLSEIDKQKMILEYKNCDDIMKAWSIYKFGKFLYYLFGSPTNDKVKGVIDVDSNKPMVEVFSAIADVNYTIIELKTKSIPTTTSARAGSGSVKTDFEEKNRNNKRLGDRGELIVLQSEVNKLENCGKKKLVNRIKHIAKENDCAGYDILSFDEYGNEIYIEVKSTRAKQGDANFYLTANELERAKGDMNYWVYIVYEANTATPKIWRINNPFENSKDDISLMPVAYRVRIGVENKSN